jgi:hypothetical protein
VLDDQSVNLDVINQLGTVEKVNSRSYDIWSSELRLGIVSDVEETWTLMRWNWSWHETCSQVYLIECAPFSGTVQ